MNDTVRRATKPLRANRKRRNLLSKTIDKCLEVSGRRRTPSGKRVKIDFSKIGVGLKAVGAKAVTPLVTKPSKNIVRPLDIPQPKPIAQPAQAIVQLPRVVVPPITDPLLMQHQLSHQTKVNRFPKIFDSALELQPNPGRILSFGCSTGEECFTLADKYPNSEILGVDLDKKSIVQAKKNNKFQDRVGFVDNLDEEAGKFDIIFCLMVLFSIYKPVPFEVFSEAIEKLSSHLNYRGLLVMYTGQHDLKATESGDKYSVIRQWTRQHNRDKRSYFNGYFRKIKH